MYLLFFIQQLSWTNWLWCSNPFVCEVTGSWSFWGMKDFLWFPGLWIVFLGLLVASGDFVLNADAPFDNTLHKSADSNLDIHTELYCHKCHIPCTFLSNAIIFESSGSDWREPLFFSNFLWNNCTILQECQTMIINCHVFHCGYKICY